MALQLEPVMRSFISKFCDEQLKQIVERLASSDNWLSALEYNVKEYPSQVCQTFYDENGTVKEKLTFANVWATSGSIASQITQAHPTLKAGDRILLLFHPGYEFILSFIACLRAGFVAVPIVPPLTNSDRQLSAFISIVKAAQLSLILTSKVMHSLLKQAASGIISLPWLVVDGTILDSPLDNFKNVEVASRDVCFIQFTSGSTSLPKGVMISHTQLVHISIVCLVTWVMKGRKERVCGWLPQYHDLGLFTAFIVPLAVGCSSATFSPFAFIKKPSVWIKILVDFRATFTVAPDFAYGLVATKWNEKDSDALSTYCKANNISLSACLSKLVVCNASEPIRTETISKFVSGFSQYGISEASFWFGYGLAEHTLTVAIYQSNDNKFVEVSGAPRSVIGGSQLSVDVQIVNPDTNELCAKGVVGEIWVNSSSKGIGYFNQPELTQATFYNSIANSNSEDTYLKTGDLGMFDPATNDLVYCGRIKDMVIINGHNYYPQDIEQAVERCLPGIVRPGCTAAFAIDDSSSEALYIVTELYQSTSAAELQQYANKVHKFISQAIGILLFNNNRGGITFLKARQIPKTTSGKIQRSKTRQLLTAGKLEPVQYGTVNFFVQQADSSDCKTEEGKLCEKICKCAAESFDMEHIDPNSQFLEMGVSSVQIVGLVGTLEAKLQVELEQNILFSHSPKSLAKYIANGEHASKKEDSNDKKKEISNNVCKASVKANFDYVTNYFPVSHHVFDGKGIGRKLNQKGRTIINLQSMNYLGMNDCEASKNAGASAIQRVGCNNDFGSSFGHYDTHLQLRKKITDMTQMSSVYVFPCVSLANMGILPYVTARMAQIRHGSNCTTKQEASSRAALFIDAKAHSSLFRAADMCKAQGVKVVVVQHNDVADLELKLKKYHSNPWYSTLVYVVDGVYSMGDGIHDISACIKVCHAYDCLLYVDDAHGFGLLGERKNNSSADGVKSSSLFGVGGGGLGTYYNLQKKANFIYTGSLSKSISCMGGFSVFNEYWCLDPDCTHGCWDRFCTNEKTYVTPSDDIVPCPNVISTKNHSDLHSGRLRGLMADVILHSPSLNNNKPLPHYCVDMALASLRQLDLDGNARRDRVLHLTNYFLQLVDKHKLDVMHCKPLPIFVVYFGATQDAMRAMNFLFANGVGGTPAITPAVPPGREGIKFTIGYTNTEEELAVVAQKCQDCMAFLRE